MATRKTSAPAAKGKDPREAAPNKGTVIEKHEHLAAAGKRRKLADLDGKDDPAPKPKADPTVTVRIPRAFNLLLLGEFGSVMHRYEAGIGEMPLSHAEHDYAKAHQVEIVDEK